MNIHIIQNNDFFCFIYGLANGILDNLHGDLADCHQSFLEGKDLAFDFLSMLESATMFNSPSSYFIIPRKSIDYYQSFALELAHLFPGAITESIMHSAQYREGKHNGTAVATMMMLNKSHTEIVLKCNHFPISPAP